MTTRTGINVIGHVAANLGVGVVTRQVIDLIESLGHPIAAFDVDLGTQRPRDDRRFDRITRETADELPYRINLFVVGLGALDWTLQKCPERFFDGSFINAAVCFWELPVLPAPRRAQLDQLDVVIGASHYLRHVFQQQLVRTTTLYGTLPVNLPAPVRFDRARIHVPEDATLFVCGFDPASDPVRKNPMAAVRAFLAGTASHADAWLVVRVNNAKDSRGNDHPFVTELRALVDGHRHIVLMCDPMTYREVIGLYAACDVYLSLHRAEGLGLGMAEAMTLGKAVVATGWSGNTTFMRQTNSCLVDYAMVPVRATLDAYREDVLMHEARWAEPNIAHAAALIAHLCRDPDARRTLGTTAASDMAAFNEIASRGTFIEELVAFSQNRDALRAFGYVRPSVPGRPALVVPPTSWSRHAIEAAVHLGARVRRRLTGGRRHLAATAVAPTTTARKHSS